MNSTNKNPGKMIYGVAIKFNSAPEAPATLNKSFIDEPGDNPNIAYQKARAAAFELKTQIPEARIFVERVCTAAWNDVKRKYYFLNSTQLAENIVFRACVCGGLKWEKTEEL